MFCSKRRKIKLVRSFVRPQRVDLYVDKMLFFFVSVLVLIGINHFNCYRKEYMDRVSPPQSPINCILLLASHDLWVRLTLIPQIIICGLTTNSDLLVWFTVNFIIGLVCPFNFKITFKLASGCGVSPHGRRPISVRVCRLQEVQNLFRFHCFLFTPSRD